MKVRGLLAGIGTVVLVVGACKDGEPLEPVTSLITTDVAAFADALAGAFNDFEVIIAVRNSDTPFIACELAQMHPTAKNTIALLPAGSDDKVLALALLEQLQAHPNFDRAEASPVRVVGP